MEQLSEHCWIATSRFCRMNTVVVTGSSGALVVDPGVHGDELAALAAQLADRFGGCALAVSTHPHWDHLLWAADLGRAPRLASARACELVADTGRLGGIRAEAAEEVPECELSLLGGVLPLTDYVLRDDATDEAVAGRIGWDGPEVEFVVHDGHAPGHLGLRVPADGVVIAGDMCSDDEVPLLDLNGAAPLDDYWDGISKLARLADQCEALVPGHGTVARGITEVHERFERDHDYLLSMATGRSINDARLDGPGREWMLVEHEAMFNWCLRSPAT
ncbi:MBL fold metallo-hydrolase [Brooklawnia sp.]|uniref:MBL fold metallo-hydrolase n=1 Tax=Brooklawnia sp. TaxID=2699740 RepID=UPI00311F58BC